MNNKKAGSEFERKLCRLLAERGFWVHNLVQNASGQPADIIAVRNGHAYLIDAKDLKSDRFRMSRVEPNQITAFSWWQQYGNGDGWLAIQYRGDIFLIELTNLLCLSCCDSDWSASVSWADIIREGVCLDDWCSSHGKEMVDDDG